MWACQHQVFTFFFFFFQESRVCEQRLKEKEKQQPRMLWLSIQIPQQGGEVFFQVALPLLADIQMKERARARLPLRPPAELAGISSSTWSRSTRRGGKMHRMTRKNPRVSGEIITQAHSPSLLFTLLHFTNVYWKPPKMPRASDISGISKEM